MFDIALWKDLRETLVKGTAESLNAVITRNEVGCLEVLREASGGGDPLDCDRTPQEPVRFASL